MVAWPIHRKTVDALVYFPQISPLSQSSRLLPDLNHTRSTTPSHPHGDYWYYGTGLSSRTSGHLFANKRDVPLPGSKETPRLSLVLGRPGYAVTPLFCRVVRALSSSITYLSRFTRLQHLLVRLLALCLTSSLRLVTTVAYLGSAHCPNLGFRRHGTSPAIAQSLNPISSGRSDRGDGDLGRESDIRWI